jgi:predicted Zn finger-like uncharacterized protein
MLIVCPSCATSYTIEPASVAPAGRTVRCARCKSTWFAGAPELETKAESKVGAFVDGVIAEAEARSKPPATKAPEPADAADDFGGEPAEAIAEAAKPPAYQAALPEQPAEPAPTIDIPATEAPPLVPPIGQARLGDTGASGFEAEDIESFAARRERLRARRVNKRRSSRLTAVILVLVAFNVALVGARNEVVRYLPQTASLFAAIGLPVNLRNLKFENVKISKVTENGIATLIVNGTIVSTGNSATEVPRLRFSVRNISGQEIYTWTALPTRSILEPGARLEFHSRLASPPAEAADVLVRFFNAQDAAAGVK